MNEKIYELEQRITRQNKERLEFWEKFKKTDEYIHAYDDTKDYFLIDNNKKTDTTMCDDNLLDVLKTGGDLNTVSTNSTDRND